MKVKDAEALTGGLGDPSKMPGRSWGIPASLCRRGGKLAEKEGTICFFCYARKGRYAFPVVQQALQRRYDLWAEHREGAWKEAMVTLIRSQCKRMPYLRWFDSGDLQGAEMLRDIVEVCLAVPEVHFWMSSREMRTVFDWKKAGGEVPENLVIRLSADKVGGAPTALWPNVSCVEGSSGHAYAKAARKLAWYPKGDNNNWFCPAPHQDNKCGECRACWDKDVVSVIYKQH